MVALDILVIFSFFIFVQVLRQRQKEYIQEFQLQKIQMSDFSVIVKHLPNDLAYDDNEQVLKADLINHFENILRLTEDAAPRSTVYQSSRDTQAITCYEIADISFGRVDVDDSIKLVELHDYYQDVKRRKQSEIIKAGNTNKLNQGSPIEKFSEDTQDADRYYQQKKKQMLKSITTLQGRLTETVRNKIEKVRESRMSAGKRLKVPADLRTMSRASSANFD